MSQYDDYQPRGRHDGYPPPPPPAGGVPYPNSNVGRAPPPGDLPPPPMGDALNGRPSAMKREGSRSRKQDLRPEFPDEASYLGSTAPDLERKNRRKDKAFRDRRDGYESEEGEQLRSAKPRRQAPRGDADYDDPEPRRRGKPGRDPRDRDDYDDRGPPPRRRDAYDDDRDAPPRRRRGDDYDDRDAPPRRSKRDDYYDDDPPPRRSKRDERPVEYGSEPIPARRRNTDSDRRPRRRRDDDYSDEEDDDPPPRRHRSQEDRRRRRDDYDDDRSYQTDSRDQRRRRQDIYDRDRDSRRRDKSRRRRSDDDYSDDDDYDRRDKRGSGRDRRNKPPREIRVGKYDIGPYVAEGKKHYATVAPFVTPLVMNMAKKYLTGGGK